jgi:hypothetical protein
MPGRLSSELMSAAWKALLVESAPTPIDSRNCEHKYECQPEFCREATKRAYQHGRIVSEETVKQQFNLSAVNPMFLKAVARR